MLNEQEKFWFGKFGKKYINRDLKLNNISNRKYFFQTVLNKHNSIKTIIEFGCNQGLNLRAIHLINKKIRLSGVDINEQAIKNLNKWGIVSSYVGSIAKFKTNKKFDLTFVYGLLIHINPKNLKTIYQKLYQHSKKFILIAEYYNPYPIKLNYRGYKNKLFKRDFAGEMLKKYKNLTLIDYGFHYHGDTTKSGDDISWFLLKKNKKL